MINANKMHVRKMLRLNKVICTQLVFLLRYVPLFYISILKSHFLLKISFTIRLNNLYTNFQQNIPTIKLYEFLQNANLFHTVIEIAQ